MAAIDSFMNFSVKVDDKQYEDERNCGDTNKIMGEADSFWLVWVALVALE